MAGTAAAELAAIMGAGPGARAVVCQVNIQIHTRGQSPTNVKRFFQAAGVSLHHKCQDTAVASTSRKAQ
eukprot:1251952-Amphidinium_carterae.1